MIASWQTHESLAEVTSVNLTRHAPGSRMYRLPGHLDVAVQTRKALS